MSALTRAYEDYLEAVLILSKRSTPLKSVDVATFLGVSKPAVSKTIKELQELGYLAEGKYHTPELTAKGLAAAKEVYGRHTLLKDFIISLGVSPEIAEIDGCKIEHVLSQETLDAIKKKLEKK